VTELRRFLAQAWRIVLGVAAVGVRRLFTIRVIFCPTRLAAEHLRSAYSTVAPTAERAIGTKRHEAARVPEQCASDGKRCGGQAQQ
jgi:hypothetical protein